MHLPQIRPQPIAESAFSPAALEPTNEAYAFAKIAGIEHPNAIYIVRVVGNESVRPATIVLNDDRETALRLFDLVSAITEQTIESSRDVFEASRIKARGD